MCKKLFFLAVAIVSLIGLTAAAQDKKAQEIKKFTIYTDKNSPDNHFLPSGWMGDIGDIRLNDQSMETPASGATCIKIIYTAKKTGGQGWAGIYWQSGEQNWGDKQTGYDLKDFNKLVFKAKGATGNEIISKIVVGGIIIDAKSGEKVAYPDSTNVEYGPIRLTKDWQEYSVPLAGKDLSYVNGGMAIVFGTEHITQEQTIYLDDVAYQYDANLKMPEPGANLPLYIYSDANSLDNHYFPSGWMPGEPTAKDLKLDMNCLDKPQNGKSCIKIEYKNVSGVRWAGIYWQNPANNWGAIPNAGLNLQNAAKLSFWARGEKGGEIINEIGMGGMSGGEFIDSDKAGIGPVKLTPEWKKYEIDLRGKDLSYVIGGFYWSTNIDVNDPNGITFYLDEIRYE